MTPTSFESMQIEQGGFFQAGTTENLYGYIKQDDSRETLGHVPKGTSTRLLTATLFERVKTRKHPKCSLAGRWIKALWNSCTKGAIQLWK